jgi:hypothetical protein
MVVPARNMTANHSASMYREGSIIDMAALYILVLSACAVVGFGSVVYTEQPAAPDRRALYAFSLQAKAGLESFTIVREWRA